MKNTLLFFLLMVFIFIGTNLSIAQWIQTSGPGGGDIRCFAFIGTNLFAGTSNGVFLTTNNGTSWTSVGLSNISVNALAVSGTSLFAGTDGSGIFVSTNSGTSWSSINNGLTNYYIKALAVKGTNLFLGTYSASSGGVFLSTNNGTSWTAINNGLTSTYVAALFVSGTNLLAGTDGDSGIYLSTNNGTSWTAVSKGLSTPRVDAFAVSGSNLFAGTPAAHGLLTGDIARIAGAVQTPYNGDFTITYISNTTFSYAVGGSPATPATGTITLQKIHWISDTGYPSVIAFYEQRMLLGATAAKPTTIWGSESGTVTNFVTGALDSDPFEYKLVAANTPIQWLKAMKMVFAGTATKILSVYGGTEKPLTPSNMQIKVQSFFGTDEIPPIGVGSELVFASRHGKKLRSFTYDVLSEAYKAPNISIASQHLMDVGIVCMAWSTEPVNTLWLITKDGKLLSVTYDQDNKVIAWTQNTTDGLFKWVSVVTHDNVDEVWCVIQRTIGASTYTYIEVLDYGLNTDAAITGTDATGKTTWTGLSHLEGKTVDILADGAVLPPMTVSGGQVVLPRTAKAVEIGLNYVTTIKDLSARPVGAGRERQQDSRAAVQYGWVHDKRRPVVVPSGRDGHTRRSDSVVYRGQIRQQPRMGGEGHGNYQPDATFAFDGSLDSQGGNGKWMISCFRSRRRRPLSRR